MKRVFRVVLGTAAVVFAVLAYVYVTLPDVRPLATTNPTTTAFMELRQREAAAEGRTLRHEHRWIAYKRISQNLKRAVLVAEDDAFFDHDGVDLEQIRESVENDLARGRPMRGASTITQQLAKNLYLSPSRDPLRKLRELVIARRLEAALSKARILELYLNLIEWGDGVWGAEAAARRYFGVSAASLTPAQAALMAGAIINPRRYPVNRPPPRLIRRRGIILARMGAVEPPEPVTEVPVVSDDAAAAPEPLDDAADGAAAAAAAAPDAPPVPNVFPDPPSPPAFDAPPDTAGEPAPAPAN